MKSNSLYAPYFTEEERRDLQAVPHDDLTGEIFLQRHLLVMVLAKSPTGPLEFELLLEKTRACNLAIRSLISLIYAELEIRKSKTPEWELFLEEAHYLAAEKLGIADEIFPAKTAEAIRSRIPQDIIEEALGDIPRPRPVPTSPTGITPEIS